MEGIERDLALALLEVTTLCQSCQMQFVPWAGEHLRFNDQLVPLQHQQPFQQAVFPEQAARDIIQINSKNRRV